MLPGIGIYGTGAVVQVVVPLLRERGFKIEALWGLTTESAKLTAKELNIPFHTNKIDDVLLRKDVDLIFVVCSPNLHSQVSVKALGIGKHVICDVPGGLCQNDVLKMVKASQYYPSLISIVNRSLRFLRAYSHMRKLIREGFIGKQNELTVCDVRVQMGSLLQDKYDWMCEDKMGGGILTLVGSHMIDLISYLTGQRAVKVHSIVRTFTKTNNVINGHRQITSPDFCVFQMEMEHGALVSVTLNNFISSQCNQEVLVCGKQGHLIVRGGVLYAFKNNTSKEEVVHLDADDMKQKFDLLHPIAANVLSKPSTVGLFTMIGALKEAFLPVEDKRGWIKEPVESAASFEDELYVQAVIDALNKSNENRAWVNVTILREESDPNVVLSAAVRCSGIS